MTRKTAERIVKGITDKIEANTADMDDWAEFWGFTVDEYEEFLNMVIKALEQEPCEDIVSSVKDLLSKVRKLCKDCGVEFFFVVPGASEWSITECDHLRKLTAYHKELELAESEGEE